MSLDSAIKDGLISLGLRHTETFISKLEAYLVLLARWNRITNLSGIKRLTDMVSVHLMDSLSVHAYLEGKTILDVGSGAGLPGIPLAILYPKSFYPVRLEWQENEIYATSGNRFETRQCSDNTGKGRVFSGRV